MTCKDCIAPDVGCKECDKNIGVMESKEFIIGPCGLDECYYGCAYCCHNDGKWHSNKKES